MRDPLVTDGCFHYSLCSLFGFSSQLIIFFSHTTPATATSTSTTNRMIAALRWRGATACPPGRMATPGRPHAQSTAPTTHHHPRAALSNPSAFWMGRTHVR